MRSPSQTPPAALYLRGPAPSSALGMLACLEVVRRPRGVQPSAGPQWKAPCVSSTLGYGDATWVSCVRVQFLSTGDDWELFTAHTVPELLGAGQPGPGTLWFAGSDDGPVNPMEDGVLQTLDQVARGRLGSQAGSAVSWSQFLNHLGRGEVSASPSSWRLESSIPQGPPSTVPRAYHFSPDAGLTPSLLCLRDQSVLTSGPPSHMCGRAGGSAKWSPERLHHRPHPCYQARVKMCP